MSDPTERKQLDIIALFNKVKVKSSVEGDNYVHERQETARCMKRVAYYLC